MRHDSTPMLADVIPANAGIQAMVGAHVSANNIPDPHLPWNDG